MNTDLSVNLNGNLASLSNAPFQQQSNRSGKPNKISSWIRESHILPITGIVGVTSAAASTVCFFGLSPIIPLVAATTALIGAICYIAYRTFKWARMQEKKIIPSSSTPQSTPLVNIQSINEIPEPQRVDLKKQPEPAPIKKTDNGQAHIVLNELDKLFRELVNDMRNHPLVDNPKTNQIIVDTFEKLAKDTQLEGNRKTEKQKELLQMINHALVKQELGKKGLVLGNNQREIQLLKCLEVVLDKNSPYYDKELLYALALEIVTREFEKSDEIAIPSKEKIRKKIHELALRARLSSIGIVDLKCEKFQAILQFEQFVNETSTGKCKDIKLEIPEFLNISRHPKTYFHLNQKFSFKKESLIVSNINHFVKSHIHKQQFDDSNCSLADFKKILEEQKSVRVDQILTRVLKESTEEGDYLKKDMSFFKKWIPYLRVECFQSNDKNKALGMGVCYSINRRITSASQENPDFEPEELFDGDILEKDRYNQAKYELKCELHVHRTDDLSGTIVPPFQYNESTFREFVKSQSNLLKPSHGWVEVNIYESMGVPGHIISLRLDEERNYVWLLDANLGHFVFETPECSHNEALEKCLDCFREIMKTYYPEYKKLWLRYVDNPNHSDHRGD